MFSSFSISKYHEVLWRNIITIIFQDVLPKKLKLMDDMKEEEDGDEDDSEDRNENADTYQHMTDDVKQ